jgi:adenylate cyclase
VMFTDVVGYAAMVQSDEAGALELLARQREVIRPIVARHGGREVKTMGDAFLVEFASALAATKCAVDIERAFHEFSRDKGQELKVRIGIHVGDVVHQGGDVFGDAVNIASRIEPLAEGGGTCISQQVYDQVSNKVSLRFTKLGARSLKNISSPVTVYRVEAPDEDNSTLRVR